MPGYRKTALITGASSGIGRSCVLRMVKAGWQVFATVRKPEDRDRLQRETGASGILMDVEDRESIVSAGQQMAFATAGLDGLANVAGIGMVRPMEYITPGDLQKIFDINLFGQIATTQAFLPMLRKRQGRIVNISSVGAHIAIPFGGALNGSKSAFGIISDTLRLEMRPFGIRVITVEPGAINTPAVEKTLGDIERVIADLPEEGRARYAGMLRAMTRRGYEREKNGSSPDVVAEAVKDALTAERPKIRYRVGKDASMLAMLARVLPDGLLDRLRLRVLGLPAKFGEWQDEAAGERRDRAA